jgi:predicted aspartyl protease
MYQIAALHGTFAVKASLCSDRRMTRSLTLFLLLLLALGVRSAAVFSSASLKSDELFASPTKTDRVGRIVAPVMINGRGPFRMVIDTGASHSTVSPALAEALGLKPDQDQGIIVNGITGTAMLPSVAIESLEAGRFLLHNVRLPVVWGSVMAGADGILGVASLQTERLMVDFKWNRVVIVEAGRSAPAGFVRIAAKRLADGLFVVPARVDGIPVQAVLDTGSQRSLGNLALREALHTDRGRRTLLLVTDVYGATTASKAGEVHLVPQVDLGKIQLNRLAVVFGDFDIFKVWDMQDTPTLIVGMDVLGTARALAFDFQRSDVYIKSVDYESNANSTRGLGMRATHTIGTDPGH